MRSNFDIKEEHLEYQTDSLNYCVEENCLEVKGVILKKAGC